MTLVPKVTVSPDNLLRFITSALLVTSSSSVILPSMNDCLSFAAWYSAFSLRSPCSLATAIACITLGRSDFFKSLSSDLIFSSPDNVNGILSILNFPKKINHLINL